MYSFLSVVFFLFYFFYNIPYLYFSSYEISIFLLNPTYIILQKISDSCMRSTILLLTLWFYDTLIPLCFPVICCLCRTPIAPQARKSPNAKFPAHSNQGRGTHCESILSVKWRTNRNSFTSSPQSCCTSFAGAESTCCSAARPP